MKTTQPTALELHYLRLSLLYGQAGAARRVGVSSYTVRDGLDRLSVRLGVGPQHRPSGLAVRLARALGWLVIPPELGGERCPVHGQAQYPQADGRRYCPTCAAERRLANARMRRGGTTCRRGHVRNGLNTTLEGGRLRCLVCRRDGARARYRRRRC